MKVANRKFLYKVERLYDWAQMHCHKPTPVVIDDTTIRVYFGVRDKKGITKLGSFDDKWSKCFFYHKNRGA